MVRFDWFLAKNQSGCCRFDPCFLKARKVASSILERGTIIFVSSGEHGFSFFQVKMFTGSVSVLLTSASLKITKKNKNYLVDLVLNKLKTKFNNLLYRMILNIKRIHNSF